MTLVDPVGCHGQAASRPDDTRGLLDDAAIRLDGAPEPTLPVLGRALDTARWRIERAMEATKDAQTLFRAAPSLFGDVARRRYLLAFQSPSEARGSGGFMGLYGILEADGGRLSLRKMGPIGDLSLSPAEAVDAPGWFERRYEGFASLWQWQQANLSGDFPTVAGCGCGCTVRRRGLAWTA